MVLRHTVPMPGRSFLRWLYSGYDWPLYRDWLAWVGLALTAAGGSSQVRHSGWWSLVGAPFAFAFYGWLLGAVRNIRRGYRDPDAARGRDVRRG
jgi:hypothetical protein